MTEREVRTSPPIRTRRQQVDDAVPMAAASPGGFELPEMDVEWVAENPTVQMYSGYNNLTIGEAPSQGYTYKGSWFGGG